MKKINTEADALLVSTARQDDYLIRAADRAARHVDFETIGLFRKYGIPLPLRLTKLAWAD